MPNNFGIIGSIPDQRSANSGVYDLNEINNLQSSSEWSNKNALTRIETIEYDASATNQINFESIEETQFRVHLLTIDKWVPATDNTTMQMRMFLSGSGTAENGTNYNYHQLRGQSAGTFNNENTTAETFIRFGNNVGSANLEHANSVLWFFNAGDSTQRTSVMFDTTMRENSAEVKFVRGVGALNVVDDVTGIQLYVNSGNIEYVRANLYGVQ